MWRFSRRDAILVALAALHAVVLVCWPAAPLIAVGLWWNSNTIAHNFIHRPFFRSGALNRLFSAALSLLLGIPQSLWRDRHLAHHAAVQWRLRVYPQLMYETGLVLCVWAALARFAPHFFLTAYAPAYLAGLVLCAAQGRWEHDQSGAPVSHYGSLHNWLMFNDGYHVEHHADPSVHWAQLGRGHPLEALESLVLRSPRLQRFVLSTHRRAILKLLPWLRTASRVAIVGGGLFPRTAIILQELLPGAKLTIIDCNRRNLDKARVFLNGAAEYRHAQYTAGEPLDCDLIVLPLSMAERGELYRQTAGPTVLVHDWIWRRRGEGALVSPLLLKRINVVQP
jgi:hypothetical protein